MSARMPTKMQPRRNPLLTMARYMSDAGADGYTGLTLLYHQTTTQLIIQWTGTDISQSEKLAAEQNLLKLLKGCDVIDSSEDIEPLEFEEGDQEPEMTEDATEMEAINFTEPTSPEFDVKKEPAEITLSSCGKSHTSGGVTVTSYSMAPLGLPTVLAETSSGSGQLSSQEPTTSCGNSLASISQSPGQNLHAGQFTPLSAKADNPLSQKEKSLEAGDMEREVQRAVHFAEYTSLMSASATPYMTASSHTPTMMSEASFQQCNRCDFTSFTKVELDRHKHWAHSGSKPHKCPFCDFACAYPHVLKRHILTHTGEKPHECKLCHKRFARNDSVLKHMETHSIRRPQMNTLPQPQHQPVSLPGPLDSQFFQTSRTAPLFTLPIQYAQPGQTFQLQSRSSLAGFNIADVSPHPSTSIGADHNHRRLSPPPLSDSRPVFPQGREKFGKDPNAEENVNQ
ncbi:zinc finger protein 358-like isoform X2 [Watersipora subatra]|uniref:zinc finger protein 358-like isoform X2 n=1 Tax=Watersipora subatra TaxID=2589382 RepID=UPI00355B43EF